MACPGLWCTRSPGTAKAETNSNESWRHDGPDQGEYTFRNACTIQTGHYCSAPGIHGANVPGQPDGVPYTKILLLACPDEETQFTYCHIRSVSIGHVMNKDLMESTGADIVIRNHNANTAIVRYRHNFDHSRIGLYSS